MAKSCRKTTPKAGLGFNKCAASPALKRETAAKPDPSRFRSPRLCRRSGPATPAPCWKLYEARPHGAGKKRGTKDGDTNGEESPHNAHYEISARKLAATLWTVQHCHNSNWRRTNTNIHCLQNVFESVEPCADSSYLCKIALMRSHNHGDLRRQKYGISLSNSNSCPQIDPVKQASLTINPTLEKATKWDSGIGNTYSDNVIRAHHHIEALEEKQTSVSLVMALQRELAQARLQVQELEHAQKSSQKEIDRFLKKVSEERTIWQTKEQERIKAIFHKMKEDLNNERKAKRKMEVVNAKLAKELAEAKITMTRSLEDLEKVRKARQLMEDVCDELAREIGEDKAEVEQLKRESMKVREEIEEERKMLQMAEVWREERVQMKLVDAKLALQEKSSALDKLRGDLEAFINSRLTSQRNCAASDVIGDVRDAELLREAACSIQIQDMKEFSYQAPTSDDVFTAFGELQPFMANNETSDARNGWDPEDGCYSSRSHTSKILTVTPETHGLNRNLIRSHQELNFGEGERQIYLLENEVKRREDGEEDETDWDYASSGDEEGSSNSYQDSRASLNGGGVDGSLTESGTDWEENKDSSVVIMEIEAYTPSAGQQRTKDPSVGQHWGGSNAGNGDCYKKISMENNLPAPTNGFKGMASPGQQSRNGICSPTNHGTWSSPDTGNPHIARGIKGCVEWPKGIQKNSLKARLLEAKMESQKSQLRHVLKQKH